MSVETDVASSLHRGIVLRVKLDTKSEEGLHRNKTRYCVHQNLERTCCIAETNKVESIKLVMKEKAHQ